MSKHTFKPGDRVRIVSKINSHCFDISSIVTIKKVNLNDYYACNNSGECFWVTDSEIEPIDTAASQGGESEGEPTDLIRNTPEKIYLNVGFNLDDESDVDFLSLTDVYWSTMQDHDADIEYIRADLTAALRAENERLKRAIHWALGYTDFEARLPGEGAYWWRKHLRELSGLTNDELNHITNEQP